MCVVVSFNMLRVRLIARGARFLAGALVLPTLTSRPSHQTFRTWARTGPKTQQCKKCRINRAVGALRPA